MRIIHSDKFLVLDKTLSGDDFFIYAFSDYFGVLKIKAKSATKQGAKFKLLLEPGSLLEASIVKNKRNWTLVAIRSHRNLLSKDKIKYWQAIVNLLLDLLVLDSGKFILLEDLIAFLKKENIKKQDFYILVAKILANTGYMEEKEIKDKKLNLNSLKKALSNTQLIKHDILSI